MEVDNAGEADPDPPPANVPTPVGAPTPARPLAPPPPPPPAARPWLLRPAPPVEAIKSGQRRQMARALRPVPVALHELLPLLTDTHNHIAGLNPSDRLRFSETVRGGGEAQQGCCRALQMHAGHYVVMSVEPTDWPTCSAASWPQPRCLPCPVPAQATTPPPTVADAAEAAIAGAGAAAGSAKTGAAALRATAALRAGFGIHPQWTNRDGIAPDGTGWLPQLRQELLAAPWAIVGEIGLDRNARHKAFFQSRQQGVFRLQLRLAAELQRPVSVHSVKADGALVDALQEEIASGRPVFAR